MLFTSQAQLLPALLFCFTQPILLLCETDLEEFRHSIPKPWQAREHRRYILFWQSLPDPPTRHTKNLSGHWKKIDKLLRPDLFPRSLLRKFSTDQRHVAGALDPLHLTFLKSIMVSRYTCFNTWNDWRLLMKGSSLRNFIDPSKPAAVRSSETRLLVAYCYKVAVIARGSHLGLPASSLSESPFHESPPSESSSSESLFAAPLYARGPHLSRFRPSPPSMPPLQAIKDFSTRI